MLRGWWRHWRRGARATPTVGSALRGRALGHTRAWFNGYATGDYRPIPAQSRPSLGTGSGVEKMRRPEPHAFQHSTPSAGLGGAATPPS
eukprot:5724369-Alexandrium_andersonii.AAC.1